MRKKFTTIMASLIAITIILVMIAIGTLFTRRGTNLTADSIGLTITDPRLAAEATAIAMEAASNADLAAAEIAKLNAQAQQEQIKAEALAAAKPALTTRYKLLAWGAGVGGAVLFIGLAFVMVSLANKRVRMTFPNTSGQYPLITEKTLLGTTHHDPNRALNSGTIVTQPSLLALSVQALFRKKGWIIEKANIEAPKLASEAAQVAITSQAQGVQLATAITRAPFLSINGKEKNPAENIAVAQRMADAVGQRMPTIRVIENPEESAQFVELLEAHIDE